MKNNQYTATPNWFKDATTSQTGSQVGQQVTNYYIQGGSSSGGTIDISQVWEALAADTTEQVNKSHLTDALTGYVTEQWITDQGFINKEETSKFVTTDTEQDITGIKSFVNGLKISDKLINIVDGILYLDCNVAVTGGLTVYAQGTQDVPSIWEGAPFDNITIHYNEETKLIEVIGGVGGIDSIDITGSGNAITSVSLTNDGKSLTFDKGETFATITELNTKWTQDDDKILSWDNAASKAHEHANKTTLDKIYEKDGVIYWDGSLAVTGGITSYALGDVEVSTIMDGVTVDGTTIAKVDGVLKVLNAGGGEAGSVAWENVTNKPSWIGITKPSYNWSEIGSKPNTLSGYGITDAYTKTDSDNRFVNVSGDTITGDLFIQRIAIGSSNEINSADRLYLAYRDTPQGINVCHNNTPFTYGSANHTIWHAGNDGSESGLDADLLDGKQGEEYLYHVRQSGTNANSISTAYPRIYEISDGTNMPSNNSWHQIFNWGSRDSDYGCQLSNAYTDISASLYYRLKVAGTWGSWFRLARVTDNVASATKLQTARTIWGQSFDGTGNVSGELSQCTRIYNAASNPIYLGNSNNSSWVYTQDIASHSGADKWAININGSTWFNKVNIGYTYSSEGSYSLNVNGIARVNALMSNNVRIECDNDGVFGSRSGEINNYNAPLQLQYNTSQQLHLCYGGGSVGIGTISPAYKLDVNGDIIVSSWIRTRGQAGWYSETYDGGWYMTDYTYVRSYNGKKVYSGGGYLAPYGGNIWITMATRSDIIDGDQNQSTDAAHALYRVKTSGGHAVVFGGLDNNVGFYGFYKSRIDSNENGTDWSTTWDATNGTITHRGNILATGGITCYASDQRAKTVIEQIKLSLKQIANAPTIRFKWNDWKIKDDGKTHIGGIAQYMQKLLPETVLEADDMLNLDYATTGYIFAVQTAKYLVKTDTEVEKLKKKVKKLEKQLKQLGYEEANIMDD